MTSKQTTFTRCVKAWCHTYIHCLSCRAHIVDLLTGDELLPYEDLTTSYFGPDYSRRLICKKCRNISLLEALKP